MHVFMRINFSTKYIYYISRFQRPSSSLEGMVQTSLLRCFSPGLTLHAICPHSLMRELYTSSLAPFSAEELTHLPTGAASSGTSGGETGPGCPSHSQSREPTPVAGPVVTNWSSWAASVMQLRRVPRASPVTELSVDDPLQ